MKNIFKGILLGTFVLASGTVFSQSATPLTADENQQITTQTNSNSGDEKYDPNMSYDDFGNVIGPEQKRTQSGSTPESENQGPVDDFGNPIQVVDPVDPPKQSDAPIPYEKTDGVAPEGDKTP